MAKLKINKYSNSGLKILSLLLGLIGLSACSVHKASFDCPNGKGMGCGSMTDVYKAIKDKSFAEEVESRKAIKKPSSPCTNCQKDSSSNNAITHSINNYQVIKSDISKNLVSRSQDKIIKIWFNSYFDEYNNFHDSRYIYTIIQPAKWVVNNYDKLERF